jgi:hypothetical protein
MPIDSYLACRSLTQVYTLFPFLGISRARFVCPKLIKVYFLQFTYTGVLVVESLFVVVVSESETFNHTQIIIIKLLQLFDISLVFGDLGSLHIDGDLQPFSLSPFMLNLPHQFQLILF